MGHEQIQQLRILNKVFDFMVLSVSFVGAVLIRNYAGGWWYPYDWQATLPELVVLFALFCVANYFFLAVHKTYPCSRLKTFSHMARCYFKGTFSALIAIIVVVFLVQAKMTSRFLVLTASTSCFLLLLLKELGIRTLLVHLRLHSQNIRPVVFVGEDEEAIGNLREEILHNPMLGIRPLGVFTLEPKQQETFGEYKNLGTLDMLIGFIEEHAVGNVIFLTQDPHQKKIQDLLWSLEKRGIEVWLKLGLLERQISRVNVDYLHEMPFLTFRVGSQDYGSLMVKNFVDRAIAFILLAVLAPLFVVIPVMIKLTSPGPIIFRQHRAGRSGKRFIMYKFRSMINNAEQYKETLLHKNEMTGPVFKVKDDPRITPVGKFLRMTSLDEIPQLWNVLMGEMSLVGPRPPLPGEVREYHGWQRRRLSMKPGITCIWQVSGRNQVIHFEDWVKMDLEYIDNWSLWLDFKILFRTIPAVLFSRGAN